MTPLGFFFFSVLASVIAGVLLVYLTPLFFKRARWILTASLGRLLDIDVEYVFKDARDAQGELMKELSRSSFVKMLTGRGNEPQRETFERVLGEKGAENFQILLPRSGSEAENDWIRIREKEIEVIDKGFAKGTLRNQIDASVIFLQKYIDDCNVELEFYDIPHIGRIVVLESCCFFTPYRFNAHGRDCRVIKYRRGGEFYDTFNRLFDQLWQRSRLERSHKVA